jgi:ABC-type sulfate transport system substrate-binding protein
VVQPRDAREASDVFYRQRIGDVLLTYENEVVLTNEVGVGVWTVFFGGGGREPRRPAVHG